MSRRTLNSKLWLGLNDTHWPFQHQPAVDLTIKIAEYLRPKGIYHKGDNLDCQGFTSHEGKLLHEYAGYNFKQHEVDPACRWIRRLQNSCGLYVQLGGNHEYRVERALIRQGMVGEAISDFFSIEQCFKSGIIDDAKFHYVPYVPGNDSFQFYQLCPEKELSSRLVVVHGWSYAEGAASVHLRAAHSASVLFGHTHRDEKKSIRDPFTGKRLMAANSGTLSRLQPLFRHGKPTEWALGCELVYIGRRSWSYYPIEIMETPSGGAYCVLPDGKELRV